MLQVQLYANLFPVILNECLLARVRSLREEKPSITWVSPLASERFREYHDAAFLNALGLDGPANREALFRFWPRGGPRWDALAQVKTSRGEHGALLIEGKSHPGELRPTGGCHATSESFEKIEDALAKTRQWIRAEERDHAWTGPLYQTANRFAYLYFLRRCLGIKAWFVHLLFVSDPTHPPTRATTKEQWEVILGTASAELGLPPTVPHYSHVYLPGLPRPATPSVSM